MVLCNQNYGGNHMNTMSFDQNEMLELMDKVLQFTYTYQAEFFTDLTSKKVAKLLLASQKSKMLSEFLNDCAWIGSNPSTTVYFFSTKITIQGGHLPAVELQIQVATPEYTDFFKFSTATCEFIKLYLLEKRIIPNPFDIA